MKCLCIAFTALFGIASAAPAPTVIPIAPWEAMSPPPEGTEFFQLQAKSSSNTTVNDQYLALKTGSPSYALSAAQTTGAAFFAIKYDPTGTYAFHNTDDTRQLVLQGSNSALLYLLDATNPSTDTIPAGQLMEWATFTRDNEVLGVNDGSLLTNRTFAAVKQADGGYTVALYDGATAITEDITPITLSLVKTT